MIRGQAHYKPGMGEMAVGCDPRRWHGLGKSWGVVGGEMIDLLYIMLRCQKIYISIMLRCKKLGPRGVLVRC